MGKAIAWKLLAIASLSLLAVGFAAGKLVDHVAEDDEGAAFPLLAKRLFLDNPNDVRLDFRRLKRQLLRTIAGSVDDERRVSLYFEYLPTGVSVNINANDEVVAASLMKTAIAMQLYKLSEQGKVDLEQKLTLSSEMLDDGFGDLYKKGAGYQLTLRELTKIMLQESDNTASNAIKSITEGKIDLEDMAEYVDLQEGIDKEGRILIGARSYSTIFKCLYLACYNSKQSSQELLQLLAGTKFRDRLTKRLPLASVQVAHKIGTFGEQYQSDCGIVYANGGSGNYLICIMFKGSDPAASEAIAALSSEVYAYVTAK